MPLTTTATSWTLHISTWITGLLGELHMINFFLNWCGCDYIDLLNGSRLPCYMTIIIHFFHATWQWLRLKVPGGHLNIKILWFWTGPTYFGIVYHTAHTKIGFIESDFKHPYRWVNANRCNHIANAQELHLSGNKPSIYQPHRCTMRCLLWNFREKWPHYNDAWLDNIQLAYSWRVLSNILLLWWCTILI